MQQLVDAIQSWVQLRVDYRDSVSAHPARRETGIDADDVADAVLTASRLLVSLSARSIAEVDDTITIAQFRVLVLLRTRGAMNQATLAGHLEVQPSTATRMVDRLVSAELVQRVPRTRREVTIDLTERGTRTVDQVTRRRRRQISTVISRMSPAAQAGLLDALNAFAAAGDEPRVGRELDTWL